MIYTTYQKNVAKTEPEHLHYDIRYLLVSMDDNFIVSDESYDLKWIEIDKIYKIKDLANIGKKITSLLAI